MTKEGFDIIEVSPESKLMISYVTNLILLGKKQDALKTITDFGKYFFDKDLSEANLRKLKGLTLLTDQHQNFNDSMAAIKEFLKSNIIFGTYENPHGQGVSNAAIAYILYKTKDLVENPTALIKFS